MTSNPDITNADIAAAHQVRKLLLAVLTMPMGPLEHLVQITHESNAWQKHEPVELFLDQGVTRQALRMLWHFRCNLEAVMPTAHCERIS